MLIKFESYNGNILIIDTDDIIYIKQNAVGLSDLVLVYPMLIDETLHKEITIKGELDAIADYINSKLYPKQHDLN